MKLRDRLAAAAVLSVMGLTAFSACATTTYVYTGNDFGDYSGQYNASDKITASIVLLNPLGDNAAPQTPDSLISFSLSDGVRTLDSSNSDAVISLGTNGTGEIDDWTIAVAAYNNNSSFIDTVFLPGGLHFDVAVVQLYYNAGETGEPGSWSVSVSQSVPEPATWTMMLLGFVGLGFAGYRASRRSTAAAEEGGPKAAISR
jgi:hypothetical protein